MIEFVAVDESHFDALIAWSETPAFLLQWAGPGLRHPLTRKQLARLRASAQVDPPSAYLYGMRERLSRGLVGLFELARASACAE